MDAPAQTVQTNAKCQRPRWKIATRVAFRLCFVYFGLLGLTTQIFGGLIPIPNVDIPDPGTLTPVRQIIFWTARQVFHVAHPLVYTDSGSGDKTFDWVESFCFLIIALVVTAVWSILDRKRAEYVTLHKWFRLFIRFALASEMILYGMAKVVPTQMSFPHLATLLEPYGNFSRMAVLWSSIGSSPAYEIFGGCAEMLGGLLLILPRTTMLGALVCLADLTQVFSLNMTYDVPVKLFSFQLLLMAVFLLAPEIPRMANFFLLHRPAELSTQPPLFYGRRASGIALAAQITFGILLVAANAYTGLTNWRTYGGGSPKSPLYGIWNVEQISIDGQTRSPLLTDYDRWRRIVFDFPQNMIFQRMDDSFTYFSSSIDVNSRTIAVTKGSDKNWKGALTFLRPAPDQLTLDGTMDNHKVHMQLQLVDRSKFMLVSRGFHWIQEYPYNR
jgi:hypothetical protein